MNQQEKIEVFTVLGRKMEQIVENEDEIIRDAHVNNPWFVPRFVKDAFQGLAFMLKKEKLERWLAQYHFRNREAKDIGIIMAGNIPMVGFHDFMTVILSGNRAVVKVSHRDKILMGRIFEIMREIHPGMSNVIQMLNNPLHLDAVIATGSDNTARYFEYTYQNIPKLIRKNRTSCCILDGSESTHELREIGKDIFSYFGLGCRNVAKMYLPVGYDVDIFTSAFDDYRWISHHPKYFHNYKFQSAKLVVEEKEFINGQFFVVLQSDKLASPVSCLYYEEYTDPDQLTATIDHQASKIQCIVSKNGNYPGSVLPGRTQFPEPWDYADQIDTMQFLLSL